MTDVEYYRYKRIIPQLERLNKEYSHHSLDNVIRQIADRLNNHKAHKAHKSQRSQSSQQSHPNPISQ